MPCPISLSPMLAGFPMLDEIRRHCALLLSEDYQTHSAAYFWLRDCGPFRRVLERLREHELSLFEVAACLAAGTSRPLTPVALARLADEVKRQENGMRETTLA
jgi:hypothetical protein